jgi:aromatic ring-opening dioxygenase catalytic subunit (LigB family)
MSQTAVETSESRHATPGTAGRMPVVYLPHGGGPWPFVELGLPKGAVEALSGYLRSLSAVAPARPRAVLSVSAHWEEAIPTVMTAASPPLYFDYYGFPAEAYRLAWPAPGATALAARVRELLGGAGLESGEDGARGYDHGTFVPLMLTFPEADVPTTQLSLVAGLDPERHLALGRALAPLRDEGVLIVGSGMSYHNMRGFRGSGEQPSAAFDGWLGETIALEASARDERLRRWAEAPAARLCHPREEHLLPLMVVAGAAGSDRGQVAFRGSFMDAHISGYHFG